MITLSVPGQLRYLGLLRAAVVALDGVYAGGERRPAPSAVYAWGLAVYEAATNIVRHAYDGDSEALITMTIEPAADRVIIRLTDRGRRNPHWPPPDEPTHSGEGGYGLHIIRQVMDEVRYDRDGQEANVLTMVAYLEGASKRTIHECSP